MEQRGFSNSDKFVGISCTSNYAIKQFILENGFYDHCDFSNEYYMCVTLYDLIDFIMDRISYQYEQAIEL